MATASAIVRTFNSRETVVTTLESLRGQTVDVEIVAVDSGSTDGTLELLARLADRVVRITQSEFSYGRSLNLGAAAATSDVHVALSSHCVLPHTDWVEIAVRHIEGGASAVVGMPTDAAGNVLTAPYVADHSYLVENPYWGFSNHASAWGAAAWKRHAFDEGLLASEDKEWSWRATTDSGPLVVDPYLVVHGDHRRSSGVRPYYRRMLKEIRSMDQLQPLPPFGLRDAVLEWGRRQPRDSFTSASRSWGRTRAVEVTARWVAGRGTARR